MSDETDKPESDTDPDDSFLSGEENDGQEFSLDQLSEAYAKVLKEQNRSGSEDPAEDDNGDLSKDGEEPTEQTESSTPESDQADAEEILDDTPCAVSPLTILEAVLFVGAPQDTVLTARKIAALMRDVSPKEVKALVKELNESYEREGAAYRVVEADKAFRMELAPEFETVREKFYGEVRTARLSQPAIDVLSIVAYHQPISREQVDKIRTRKSSALLTQLLRRQLLEIRTTDTQPPKRQYITTEKFLAMFGLEGLEDLPQAHEVSSIDQLAQ